MCCRGPFDRAASVADRAAIATQQSGRGFSRVKRQNRAFVALRLCPYASPSDQPAIGRVPCRPTPSRLPGSWPSYNQSTSPHSPNAACAEGKPMSTQPDRDQLQRKFDAAVIHFLPQATVGIFISRLISTDGSKGRKGPRVSRSPEATAPWQVRCSLWPISAGTPPARVPPGLINRRSQADLRRPHQTPPQSQDLDPLPLVSNEEVLIG